MHFHNSLRKEKIKPSNHLPFSSIVLTIYLVFSGNACKRMLMELKRKKNPVWIYLSWHKGDLLKLWCYTDMCNQSIQKEKQCLMTEAKYSLAPAVSLWCSGVFILPHCFYTSRKHPADEGLRSPKESFHMCKLTILCLQITFWRRSFFVHRSSQTGWIANFS